MIETKKKTPICSMDAFTLTTRLSSALKQAYHRRARQLPVNLADIVETFKNDILKAFPTADIDDVDDALTVETLHCPETPLSPTFFFNAVKKHCWSPRINAHNWDEEDRPNPDHEVTTIALLDVCRVTLQRVEAAVYDPNKPLQAVILEALPAFNPRREYGYLVRRGQLAEDADAHFFDDALVEVNTQRMRSRHHRLTLDEAKRDPDVKAQCQRLAVIDWLRSTVTQGVMPSDILNPIIDENDYQTYRQYSA